MLIAEGKLHHQIDCYSPQASSEWVCSRTKSRKATWVRGRDALLGGQQPRPSCCCNPRCSCYVLLHSGIANRKRLLCCGRFILSLLASIEQPDVECAGGNRALPLLKDRLGPTCLPLLPWQKTYLRTLQCPQRANGAKRDTVPSPVDSVKHEMQALLTVRGQGLVTPKQKSTCGFTWSLKVPWNLSGWGQTQHSFLCTSTCTWAWLQCRLVCWENIVGISFSRL